MSADPSSTEATLTAGTIAFRLTMVVLLVAANAFFVAAEFALVAVRRSRIDQLVTQGNRSARVVQQALTQLDRYISGTQLGITLASLALGWIGEPAIAVLVDAGARHWSGISLPSGAVHSGAAILVAFLVVTFLHIVFGELMPKSVALIRPERVSLWVTRPLIVFSNVMSPFIVLLNGTANRLLRLVGVEPASEGSHVHSPGGAPPAGDAGPRPRHARRERLGDAGRRVRLPQQEGVGRDAPAHRGGGDRRG